MLERRRPEFRESHGSFDYVDIESDVEMLKRTEEIRPEYTMDSNLTVAAITALSEQDRDKMTTLRRNPALEQADIDTWDDKKIIPKEIADKNFAEMERATALKWEIALNKLFSAESFGAMPIRGKDGRAKIAIPGCNFGFEISGVLDFFNKQSIPVDIDAVDIGEAGSEVRFMDLDRRTSELGSKVDFHPNTDAKEFYRGKQSDMVILRHPGFIFEQDQYGTWKGIIKTMTDTKPGIIIVSTYGHRLEDDSLYIDAVLGMGDRESISEGEVFQKLLADHGYKTTNDYNARVDEDRLRYPISPYMISSKNVGDGRLEWDVPVDRDMVIYGSEEYLSRK